MWHALCQQLGVGPHTLIQSPLADGHIQELQAVACRQALPHELAQFGCVWPLQVVWHIWLALPADTQAYKAFECMPNDSQPDSSWHSVVAATQLNDPSIFLQW